MLHSLPKLKSLLLVGALGVTLVLTGCGGGDDNSSSSSSSSSVSSSSNSSSSQSSSSQSNSSQSSSAASSASSASGTSSNSSAASSSSSSASAEVWDISTGANADDLVENYSFPYTVSIDLGTMGITTSSARLLVGAASGSVTPITLDGTTVITVTQESLGVSIDANMPSGEYLELALTGSYTKTVTLYSNNKFKLTLNGVNIASTNGPAINVQSGKRAFVTLANGTSNVLSAPSTWTARTLSDGSAMDMKSALFAEGALIFSGTGSLSVTSTAKHGIASDDHIRLRSGTITVSATAKDGVRANDSFVMDGGSLAVTAAAGKGVKVEGKEDDVQPLGFIAINAGTLTVNSYDKAVTASWESAEDGDTTTLTDDPDPRVTVNGGTITLTTTATPTSDLAPEGLESKSTLTINDGTLIINTTDDAINAANAIVVNGGRIYAHATKNDAIDSNGTMTITGGIIVADGASGAEGGLDCDNNTFKVTGGTFIGIGGRNSSVTASVSTQNVVTLTNGVANSLLVIKDGSGNVAFAYTIPKASSAMLLSSPLLTTGTSYTVYTGGTIGSYGENFNGLYMPTITHSGGTASKTFTIASRVTNP
ncbi:MAG: carbohydrate-binding domain-containing protein [Steroidobacteraceae bacterium]